MKRSPSANYKKRKINLTRFSFFHLTDAFTFGFFTKYADKPGTNLMRPFARHSGVKL